MIVKQVKIYTKIVFWIILLLNIYSCSHKVSGEYINDERTGHYKIKFTNNKTYIYSYSHDTWQHFSYGRWRQKKDTVYLSSEGLYDTIRVNGKDSLILSLDQKSDLITVEERVKMALFWAQLPSSIHLQNQMFQLPLQKLIIKKRRLFTLKENGTINKEYSFKSK